MWQLCLTPWESVPLVPLMRLLSPSLYGSTCCKLEVCLGPHCAIITMLVLMSSNCHSPSRCLSYLCHEQGEHCLL
ncbi:hypothetical protein JB92DRAFT_2869268 [Gautieria morchelliformis]|nr:hypothetical protein JB92DRAFT_2869268 [Gautieria morchelliformis]